ncbi:hypothetical protein QFZ82_003986 [Streptomyces sp. V4I23]|uniref:hypothetical protein n=1 Tax=Streptomyces sp. V4I23 TaxID=3042282 RepID=UPI0027852F92|nr:hypothetical protein [Streptomyces sp. V4I23]MDQ1009501.1 hypothetical protein [Streptomyces sp. V4I23]
MIPKRMVYRQLLSGRLPFAAFRTDHGVMVSSIVVQYTDLLRTSDYDLWSRLRELLRAQGLDPDRTIVVDLLQEGPDHEDGQVISEEGRVYRFTLSYDQAAEHGARSARLDRWTDITDSWRRGSLATRTADAFAWMSSPESLT